MILGYHPNEIRAAQYAKNLDLYGLDFVKSICQTVGCKLQVSSSVCSTILKGVLKTPEKNHSHCRLSKAYTLLVVILSRSMIMSSSRWWSQIFLCSPLFGEIGNDPIWLIFFRWVVQPPTSHSFHGTFSMLPLFCPSWSPQSHRAVSSGNNLCNV